MFDELFHREKPAPAPAPPQPDLASKLESIEQIVRATAWAVLYIGQRQSSMSITTDALNNLEAKLSSLEAAMAGVINAQHAAAAFEAEAANDAARIQQLEARIDQLVAQLGAAAQPVA